VTLCALLLGWCAASIAAGLFAAAAIDRGAWRR
jgi:hypothetical protein